MGPSADAVSIVEVHVQGLSGFSLFLFFMFSSMNSGLALGAPLAQKTPPPETLMLFAHQKDAPVHITQASFNAENVLLDAQLENTSHQKIRSYRIGWASVRKDDIKLSKSNEIDVPKDVDTTSTFSIPGPDNAAREDLARHPPAIVFYIVEVQFVDSARWQADPRKIHKEVAASGK